MRYACDARGPMLTKPDVEESPSSALDRTAEDGCPHMSVIISTVSSHDNDL
jgi:hypothetical protein